MCSIRSARSSRKTHCIDVRGSEGTLDRTFRAMDEGQRHAVYVKSIKESMLQLSQHSEANLTEWIGVRLPSLVPSPLLTPDHPSYADMILTAIEDLEEKRGSTKASISEFIKSKHQHLPLAHSTYLTHHLQKLVETGDIVSVTGSRYTLPNTERKRPRVGNALCKRNRKTLVKVEQK
ncbi:hypothetical protein ACHQM5_002486 [Ranunculus cassubicifolius]